MIWFKLHITLPDVVIWGRGEAGKQIVSAFNTHTHDDTLHGLVPEPKEKNMSEKQFLFCLTVIGH